MTTVQSETSYRSLSLLGFSELEGSAEALGLTFVWQSEPDEPDPDEFEPEPDELSEELRARRVFLLEGLLFFAEALEPLEGLELISSTEEKEER